MSDPLCLICGLPIRDGQKALVSFLSTLKSIPSKLTFAVEKPEVDSIVSINHANCEGYSEE